MRSLPLVQYRLDNPVAARETPRTSAKLRSKASELLDSHALKRYSVALFHFLFVMGCAAVLLAFLALAMREIFLQFSGFESMELLRGFAAVSASAPN